MSRLWQIAAIVALLLKSLMSCRAGRFGPRQLSSDLRPQGQLSEQVVRILLEEAIAGEHTNGSLRVYTQRAHWRNIATA